MDDDQLDNITLLKHFCSNNTKLTSTEKLVAIVLLSHRNNISMMCCPGLTLIGQEASLNRSTVQRIVKSLIDKKELFKLKITIGKLYLKSQYYFLFDIDHAKNIYKNESSIFFTHHQGEVENFEHCLSSNFF